MRHGHKLFLDPRLPVCICATLGVIRNGTPGDGFTGRERAIYRREYQKYGRKRVSMKTLPQRGSCEHFPSQTRTADLDVEIDVNAEVVDGDLWRVERVCTLSRVMKSV